MRRLIFLTLNHFLFSFIYFFLLPKFLYFSPNYVDNYIFSILYILFFTINVCWFYKKEFSEIFKKKISLIKLESLFLFFVLLILIITILNNNIISPNTSNTLTPFLDMNTGYVLAKFFEIIYQQIICLLIIYTLSDLKFSLRKIQIIFTFVFGLSHLLLIFILNPFWVTIFTIGSIFAGIIFPYQILKFKNGYFLSLVTHWLFYLLIFIGYKIL